MDTKLKSVIATDCHGNQLWMYKRSTGNEFDPIAVSCDGNGRIVILDNGNDTCHVVNRNGGREYLVDLNHTEQPLIEARCLSIDKNNQVWIGAEEYVFILKLH